MSEVLINLWNTFAKNSKIDLDLRVEKFKQDNAKLEKATQDKNKELALCANLPLKLVRNGSEFTVVNVHDSLNLSNVKDEFYSN